MMVAKVFVSGVAASLVLAGCAAFQPSPEQQRQAVKERVEARWDSVLKRDWAAAYEFLTPATRAGLDLQAYSRRGNPLIYRAAVVRSVECASSDVCRVTLDVTYATRRGLVTTPLAESWVRVGWRWFFVLQD